MGARAVAMLTALIASGCGYHLVGLSGSLPDHLRKLYVAPLVNQTTRPELDQRLTEQITQEWVRRGRYEIVSSAQEADAVLSGSITSAVVAPVRFDDQGRATDYQLSVSADVNLVDRTSEKPIVLWRDQRFTRVVSYQVEAEAKDYFDREVEAMERLASDFARGLVVTILEGF